MKYVNFALSDDFCWASELCCITKFFFKDYCSFFSTDFTVSQQGMHNKLTFMS